MQIGWHVSNRLKVIYSDSSHRDMSIDICICPICGGGGVPGGGPLFGGGAPIFSGPLLRNFKYIVGFLSSSPVDLH